MSYITKKENLEKLNKKMSICSKCTLQQNCTHLVFGSGNPSAEIMFIGEAEVGLPFVGSSGKILEKILSTINMKREDVYLTNILKCRPPENRDPLPEEIAACLPYLEEQIKIIEPKIIITLGRHALNCFLPDAKISEIHGQIISANLGKIENIKIYPIHHPAAARQNKKTRAIFEEDFHKIPKLLMHTKKEH